MVVIRRARRSWLLGLASLAAAACVQPGVSCAADRVQPPFVIRGLPGPGHVALKALEGDWDVAMELYAARGSADAPFRTTLRAHRERVGDGRYLLETLVGDLPGGDRYWRMGMLGYNGMEKRYEWVTQDALNSGMMIYFGPPDDDPGFPIVMSGTFTDQGLLGENYAGRRIGQRTVITMQDEDHHMIDIFFTPPGENERLIDRKYFSRVSANARESRK